VTIASACGACAGLLGNVATKSANPATYSSTKTKMTFSNLIESDYAIKARRCGTAAGGAWRAQ